MNSTSSASSYLPRDCDEITVQNGNGGYIGGVCDNGAHLVIVDKAQEWEKFIFETEGDTFSLRQSVSNLYVGAVNSKWQLLKLTPEKKLWESFRFHIIQGGMVQIQNHKGLNLAAGEDKRLALTSNTPIKEAWKFTLVTPGINNPTNETGVSLPVEGKVYGIAHNKGGYIGGVRDLKKKLDVMPKFQEYEKWTVEKKDNLFAFKQKVSGLYLGDSNLENERTGLVGSRQQNELFSLEWKGSNNFFIRNLRGLYLSPRESHVIWTASPSDNELWKFEEEIGQVKQFLSPTNGQIYGVQHVGSSGFLGNERTKDQALRFAGKLDEWEQFIFDTVGGVFALKQKVSGLFPGVSDNLFDPIRLAEKHLANEIFQLADKTNGLFAIKNHNGFWLSRKGDYAGWSTDCGNNELWRFVPV